MESLCGTIVGWPVTSQAKILEFCRLHDEETHNSTVSLAAILSIWPIFSYSNHK